MADKYDLIRKWKAGQAEPPPSPTGTYAENYNPSWRDRLADLMGGAANAISGKPYDEARRDSMTLLGLAPGTGTGIAAEDMARDFRQGDYKGAALNALGVIPDGGTAVKAIFLGAASKLADREALQLAKSMAEGGASRKDVLQKTGWFQQHGDWKYEIDDSKAGLTEPARDALLGNKGEFGGPNDIGRGASDLFQHPELFKAHPDIADTPAHAKLDYQFAGGQYHPETGLQVTADRTAKVKDIGLHELQHNVQRVEGFPRGGNPADNTLVPDARRVGALAGTIYDAINGQRRAFTDEKLGNIMRDDSIDPRERLARLQAAHDEWSRANPDDAKLRDEALQQIDVKGPRAGYRNLAGEVEARNVQARQDFTPEQRRDVPPWETQDVPDLFQIVRRPAAPAGGEAMDLGPLKGAPPHVEGPVPAVSAAAEEYARRAGIDLKRQPAYAEASPRRGRYIAQAYDRMPHDPADPRVAASYQALADETMKQWQAMLDSGAKIDFLKPGAPDPYPGGPRDALADLRANNHLSVFPTEQGFGSVNASAADNPMLAPTGVNHGGHDMLVNDAFRAVHDYFGHGMEGANFGPRGEENAWQAHKRLFSPDAVPALTTETRGQNSWVNFGPYGDANRANPRDTTYADQKAGLLPPWATKEGGMPMSYRAQQVATLAALASALGLAGSAQQDK
jgi:hypothetical protein